VTNIDTNSRETNDHNVLQFRNLDLQKLHPDLILSSSFDDPDVDAIIRPFLQIIDEQLQQTVGTWKQAHQQKLNQLLGILEAFSWRLNQLADDHISISLVWRELEISLKANYDWTDSLSYEFAFGNLWTAFRQQFSEQLKTVPPFVEIPIQNDNLTTFSDDTFRLKTWRDRRQTKKILKDTALVTRNRLRRLSEKTGLGRKSNRQNLDLQSFLTYFLELPTTDILLEEWLNFLQQLAGQLYELHTRTVDIKDNLLFLEDLEAGILRFEKSKLTVQLEKIQSHIRSVKSQAQHLDDLEAETLQRFHTHQTEVYKRLKQHWNFVEAGVLSNADFGEKKISNRRKKLKQKLAGARERWAHHFQGEQGEWQKDIELSILQLQTAQICCDIINRVERKLDTQIMPAFSETQETVVAASESFRAMKAGPPASFKTDIIKQDQSILHAMRQEKLPRLLNAVTKAGLNNILRSWTLRTRTAIDTIADEHIVLVKRDIDSSIPKSKKEVTRVFRKMVLEDLFSTSQQEHQQFIVETQESIDKICRGISMIDQVVEVNLEAALSLLEEGNEKEAAEDARDAVIEGLNLTTLQLNELAAQAEQFLAVSKKELLRITAGFENQLQELAGIEELNEAHLQLASITLTEKSRIYYRKSLVTLRRTPPNLVKLSIDSFKGLQNSYGRLREMTGFVADKVEAEANLTRFLADTEKHIEALPDAYRRLFDLDALSDERFFMARDAEMALLEHEFERWTNGKFSAVAVIGERGCGMTTLLNFAEKQFYQGYPVIKINLLDGETMYTEEELFYYLKSALVETDLKHQVENINDLEDMINQVSEQKIFIVENLQQLFVRTTFGFNALERFLLFISRTHKKIHWVLTCTIYSWEYFGKVIDIDQYVQQKVVLDSLSKSDLEKIIVKRHKANGYQMVFGVSDEIAASRRYKKLTTDQERQTYLQNVFFEQLTKLAAGNITVAFLFWLRSYEDFSQDKLTVPATIEFDPSFLYELSAEELFTLAALLQHDILNEEHHALIFHQDMQQSLLILNRMANKGFLVHKSNGYQIHPFLYRGIVRVLKRSNIIH
jgi:hypothetical protein